MRIQRFIPMVLVGVVAMLVFAAAPALAAAPETPVTVKATEVTGDSAVLRGELNPGKAGEPGEKYEFLYSLSASECHIPGETEHLPETPVEALGAKEEAVSIEAGDLRPGTTYSFCVLAEQGGEGAQSPSLSFTTPTGPLAPFVLKSGTVVEGVTPFAAKLAAKINPEQETTKYSFTLATNEALTQNVKTISGSEELPAEFSNDEASVITGNALTPSTKYYFRVSATNKTGTTLGTVASFTTAAVAVPEVVGESVSALSSAEPQLEAKINPKYEETTYRFEYATNRALTENLVVVPGAPPAADLPGVDEEVLAGPVGITDLRPGPYFYRVVAENPTSKEKSEPAYGPTEEFLALGDPVVTTNPVGVTARATANVSGTVTPQGLPSTYHFAYIPFAAYEAAVAKGLADPFAVSLGGRDTYETGLTFLNFFGHEASFEDYEAHPVELRLEELEAETTYVYALVAHNELGTTTGAPQTFTTQAKAPPVAVPAVAVQPSPTPDLSAIFPAPPVIAPIAHGTIGELDAREAREGKAVNPGKKKSKGKKRDKPKKKHGRKIKPTKRKNG